MEGLFILNTAKRARDWYDRQIDRLPLPEVDAKIVYGATLIMSIVFFFAEDIRWQIMTLAIVLVLSWVDRPLAKRHEGFFRYFDKERRWIVDSYADRLSESVIAAKFFLPFFPLFLVNCVISIATRKTRMFYALPVRHLLLLYLLANYFLDR
jgi:hypothetical protein